MATIYRESLSICLPPERIWAVLSDLTYFAYNDPFHHNLRYNTDVDYADGLGTSFEMEHSYFPIFPFPRDRVFCRVTNWDPNHELAIHEEIWSAWKKTRESKRVPWRDHTQRFALRYTKVVEISITLVTYEISYADFPWWLAPLKWWAQKLIRRRMREKLYEIEREARSSN